MCVETGVKCNRSVVSKLYICLPTNVRPRIRAATCVDRAADFAKHLRVTQVYR